MGRIFPCNDSTIATYAKNLTSGTRLPSRMVVVATPIGTDVILSGRVGDVVTFVGAIDLLRVVTCNEILPDRMVVLTVKDAETPWTIAQLGSVFVLSPTIVRCWS